MSTGNAIHGGALLTAAAALTSAGILPSGAAVADSNQDNLFLALLEQHEIPALGNVPRLIAQAHSDCRELDGGISAGDLVVLKRNRAYAMDPAEREYPVDRLDRTMARFITSAVEAYCPRNTSRIASIAGISVAGVDDSTFGAGAHGLVGAESGLQVVGSPASASGAVGAHRFALVSLIRTVPSGEVQDPNPPQVPPTPPTVERLRPPDLPVAAPPRPRQQPPPPQQMPPPPPPQAPPNAGPQPGRAGGGVGSGGGISTGKNGGGNQNGAPPAPPPPPAEPPGSPGFVRLAP